jgi:uncharacterized Rossmann fold enzyme
MDSKYISAFIESNEELWGTTVNDIPIMSYEDYKKKDLNSVIIITPRNHIAEIRGMMTEEDESLSMLFEDVWSRVYTCYFQIGINKIISMYSDTKAVYLYGYNFLSMLLLCSFLESGYEASLVLPSDTASEIKKGLSNMDFPYVAGDMLPRDISPYVLLTQELSDCDKDMMSFSHWKKFYHFSEDKELFRNPKLERFKGIHKGQRCFIVANGPSLKMEDLQMLYTHHEITFGMNGIFQAFTSTDWRPDYYVASDANVSKWKNDIWHLESKAIFLSDVIDIENDISDKIYRWHLIFGDEEKNTVVFSDDFSIGGYSGYTVTYEGCLQLAVYMGFKEIYLIGVDNCNYSKDDCGHYYAGYRTGGQKECLLVDKTTLAYQSAKAYADAHGIKIYNATRGGKLEVFERVDFDSLFEKAAEGK